MARKEKVTMIESYAHSYSFIHSFIGLADFRVGFDYIIIKIELVCSTILKNLILGRRVIMFDEMEIMRHGERTNIVFKKGRENNWIKKKSLREHIRERSPAENICFKKL